MARRFQIRRVALARAVRAHPAAVIGLSVASSAALTLSLEPLAEALSLSTAATLSLVTWLVVALVVFAFKATRRREVERDAGELVLGADGFVITERSAESFISFHEVESLKQTRRGATVTLVDGEITLRTSEECARALQAALDRFRTQPEFAPATLCGRRDESFDDWRARMRELRGDYRGGALSEEDLRRIATNPTTPRDQRVGAVLALGSAPRKVRVEIADAAEEMVEPALQEDLRRALAYNEERA